ncbi:MAG: LytR/AlgR family response regulator transcription factor, partial [Crocinitomicaceae bacterium]
MKKVLIIDDENRTRSLIAKMIDSFGLDVQAIAEGENVQSGIKAIEKHNPDIVFLDIQMPDGTGFDVIRSIENKSFEVIFITAHEEFAIKAIKFSALDYLLKPVDAVELKAALEKALVMVDNNSKDG